jgi:hypothetical protein
MAQVGSERLMIHVRGVFSFLLTPDGDAEGRKWPNGDPKEFVGNLLANCMGEILARNQKGPDYVEDRSKSNTIFSDFPKFIKI